jgi:predicted alpha/beta hydrolase family esterase
MKNAIILHGSCDKDEYYSDQYPSLSNSHWLPWLQKQLLIKDFAAITPEIPNAFEPEYMLWQKEFERYDITPGTLLVGHSCGGGFLVRWLSEHRDQRVGKVVLVAPWLDPDRKRTTDFFEFELDENIVSRTAGLTIFCSDDDMDSVQGSVKTLKDKLQGISYREFQKYGHFTYSDMQTDKFPELLEELLA